MSATWRRISDGAYAIWRCAYREAVHVSRKNTLEPTGGYTPSAYTHHCAASGFSVRNLKWMPPRLIPYLPGISHPCVGGRGHTGLTTPCVTALYLAIACAAQAQPDPTQVFHAARDSAALLARDGRHDDAVAQLQALRTLHAQRDAQLRADLVTVLEWAGRAQEAIEIAAPLQPALLEDYALLAWARALRSTGASAEALTLLQPQIARPGRDVDIAILHALLLTDLERDHEARMHIVALAQVYPDQAEVHAAAAFIHRRAGSPADALGASARTVRLQPDHREARRQRVFALTELGATSRARELAAQSPELFSDTERDRLTNDAASQNLRWTRAYPDDMRPRFELADAAIAELQGLLESQPGTGAIERSRLDLVVALRLRERMYDAVAQYEQLLEYKPNKAPFRWQTPGWVRMEDADTAGNRFNDTHSRLWNEKPAA